MDLSAKIFDAAHKRLNAEIEASSEYQLEVIAGLWSAYLRHPVTPRETAEMMLLLKIGRANCRRVFKEDDYVDMCGYAALAAQKALEFGGGND